MLLLSSCGKDILVEEKIEFPGSVWLAGDVKSVIIEAPDTTGVYDMEIKVMHDKNYAFQNFYIRLSTKFPSGKQDTSITSLELLNANGSWAGDCSGDECSLLLPLQTRFTFPEKGKYEWHVEPYMRNDTVRGINSIEVRCKKAKL